MVDTALKTIFHEEQAPLVLARIDYLLPICHQVSEYANFMKAGITGSPEHLRPEVWQEQAWTIVEPYFRQEVKKVIEQYQQLAVTAKATDNIFSDLFAG